MPKYILEFFGIFFEEISPLKILSLGLGSPEFADYAHKQISGADIEFVSPSNINDGYLNSLCSKKFKIFNEVPPKFGYNLIFSGIFFPREQKILKNKKISENNPPCLIAKNDSRYFNNFSLLCKDGKAIFIVNPSFFYKL